jgi:uncharacterized membrane protein YecN with MAPEG domain
MNRDQKIVAVGAATGVLTMLGSMYALAGWMPALPDYADAGDRFAFAVNWLALAAAPLFFAIASVGTGRFKSEAIDPTAGKESRAMVINGRVADNTLQQYALLVAASLAVAASAHGRDLWIVAAAAVVFVVARVAFWIGYRIHPLYRAAGMAATSYLCVLLFGLAAWFAWR